MKKKVIQIILLISFFSFLLCGVGQAQKNLIINDTGFSVPPYIKRGLVLYYDAGGYVTNQGKRDYVTFQKIIIIQAVEGQNVIGTVYTINNTSLMLTTETKLLGIGGSGIFYIHPDYAKKMQGKEKFGYKFSSPGIIEYKDENLAGKIEYDPKSGVFLGAKVKDPTTESVETYKGYEYIELPPLPSSFPIVAKRDYTYSVYTIFQNLNTPFGTINISPISFNKKTAKYKMLTTTTQGIRSSKEIYSTTLLGPHYIHPEILGKESTIIELKQKDFKLYIQGEDEYGKITHLVINGTELYRTHIDPSSGLILYQDQFIVGMNSVIRIILNQ